MGCDAVHAGLAGRGHPEGGMGLLDGFGMDRHVVEGPKLSGVLEGFPRRPPLGQNIQRFVEASVSLVHGDVQLVILAPLVPPGPLPGPTVRH